MSAPRGSVTPSRRISRDVWPFVFLAGPNLLLLAVFTFRPMIYTLWFSLSSSVSLTDREFAGLAHYTRLFDDPEFWTVLMNTAIYAFGVVLVAQALAFLLALALNRQRRGAALLRTLAFTPHVTLTVAAAITWLLVLDSRSGPAAAVYDALGVEGPRWLAESGWSLAALMIVGTWKEIGFATLFFLAALQNLPAAPYEAARIEGATYWQVTRCLTPPMMTPAIYFLGVSGLIAASKTFDTPAVMTQGGPVYPDSSLFVYHLYTLGFREYQTGYASAFAAVVWGLMLLGTAIQLRLSRRWVVYET